MATPSAATRKKLQRKFRLRGFTLKVDALEEAAAFLARFPDAEDDALDLLLDELDKEPRNFSLPLVSFGTRAVSSILDRDAVRRVVALLVEAEEAVDAASPAATSARSALRVVDSFVVPRFHYDPIKKVFYDTEHKITSGFFVENTVILAEGELLSNGIFQVNTCGFPPLEDREASLSMLMGLDFFGGGVIAAEETVRLSTLEKKAMNDMFVILSDVWLDSSELVATITHQSHLCPLPLTVQPIIWNYDHCLRLYPTPHTIVLGDKSEQKAFKYAGITCFNPGSFANDSSFAAYRPCTKEMASW
uniref:DNA polymerase II subunit 2 n=1 Tax=Oryza sativa subsp. japonica TaxID=39947 RepID=Q6YSB1_ORYSJ|nr:DNA polymerase epsilon subunit B-like protein [Oryza sativa Japonica Group]